MIIFLALLCLPLCLVTAQGVQKQLADLAAAGNGVIKLDPKSFDLLTSPKRTWSASIQLTALDGRRKCFPCKLVLPVHMLAYSLNIVYREFDPAWNAVAKAWSSVPKEKRDNHFFGTLDFDEGPTVFQNVVFSDLHSF